MTLLLLAAACGPADLDDTSGGTSDGVVDARLTIDDVSTYQEGDIVLFGPDVTVQPGVEEMWCVYGTWPGGDAGIVAYETWEATYGHHVQIMGTTTPAIDVPDGTVTECTTSEQLAMENLEPLALPTSSYRDGVQAGNSFNVPPGMAVKIDANSRYIMQSHVLNTGSAPVREQDLAVFRTIPADEVETWMAPIVANTEDFVIPAHDVATTTYECTYSGDYHLLSALGHMHEWGTSISAQMISADGETVTPLYDVPAWETTFRDAAPLFDFGEEGIPLPSGTTIRTSCAWNNTTDMPLEFPSEMCVTVGFIYPALVPEVCSR